MSTLRGALIVMEGCDRVGKTTQCKKLVNTLKTMGKNVEYINFPDRSTGCGALIDAFLRKQQDFPPQTIHLLFTLNRWEAQKKMEALLIEGTTLIVDRYSYSGVAFSAAKGVNFEWCKAPESGLLKPDLVLYLAMSTEALIRRGGFGDEVYELPEFQRKVKQCYNQLKDDTYWLEIDADKTENVLHEELKELSLKTMNGILFKTLDKLW